MAGFKTHITVSGLLGVGYGGAALALYDVPLPTCVLAGGLCGISGMLPDLDSESGVPLRESVAFAAAIAPIFLVERFRHMGWSPESIVLAGALAYLLVRFGLAAFLRRYTVHRGMFHSIPAALIAAEIGFLLCEWDDMPMRLYKSGGIALGYMSHLMLDELYSMEWYRGRLRFKRSFGTAVKLWGGNTWGNISTYLKLAVLTYVAVNDPNWMRQFDETAHQQHQQRIAEQPVELEAKF